MFRPVLGAAVSVAFATSLAAQRPAEPLPPPMIDTIIVLTENWFSAEEVQATSGYRWLNALRFKTRPYVVRRELLFRQGEPFDLLRVEETARNLRARGLFSLVRVDTTRVDGGRFAVVLRTRDAWSTQVQLNGSVTGGTFTWATGLTETNFLGTGDLVSAVYRKGVDRNSVTLGGRMHRLLGSRLLAEGVYQNFSDGRSGAWRVGLPFKSLAERFSMDVFGEAAAQQILQFRTRSLTDADTTRYWRRALRGGLLFQFAPVAENTHYVRLGSALSIRREEYILIADTAMVVPDTVTGVIEVFVEARKADFHVVNYFNGFGVDEDLDVSTVVRLTARLAPAAFGYEETGIGGGIFLASGTAFPRGYLKGSFSAHGLYDAGGLDSGRVNVAATLGIKPALRHATFVHGTAGIQKAPPPGQEFDLGHGRGPRTFSAHAFTGTRTAWGTLEHRWFIWDAVLGSLGLGLAGFVDYGGAWYPNQAARFGGNVGLGLRQAHNRSSGAGMARIDVAYRFGDGFGKRWGVSLGRGLLF